MNQVNRSDEDRMKEEFIESRQWFFGSPEGATLIKALEGVVGGEVKVAYFVMWLPEQCEDTYWILVNGKVVIEVEVDVGWRFGETELTSLILNVIGYENVGEYRKRIQGSEEILQLKLALELSEEELKRIPGSDKVVHAPIGKIHITDAMLESVISQFTVSKEELNLMLESDKVTQASVKVLRVTDGKSENENPQFKFTISCEELVVLLQSPRVIQAPIGMMVRVPHVKPAKDFFVRETDVGRVIGIMRRKDAPPQTTTLLSVIVDTDGDLVSTYPGPFKRIK